MADMNGQVALVTGGVRGIGLAVCEAGRTRRDRRGWVLP